MSHENCIYRGSGGAHVNDSNAVAIPFAKGFGWGGKLNPEYVFEKLFGFSHGQGDPPGPADPFVLYRRICSETPKERFFSKSRGTNGCAIPAGMIL